ncbi:MAG: AAA family ATPase, partial [Muribaculaceae bacterium]|nr:AAA family ATPase [Muribaculaceae bacterium]
MQTLPQKYDQVQPKCDQANDQAKPGKLKLSNKQRDIKNFCSIPRTTKEILNRVGVKDHFDSRKRYIYDLVAAGVLEPTIPDKPTDPNQKYRRK